MKILSDNNYYFNDLKFSELSNSLTLKVKNKIKEIFTDIDNIKKHFKLNELESIKLLYFNNNIIHPLLYEFDNIIKINSIEKVDNISYYFYLSLLIAKNPNIVYYYYSIQFIRKINEYNINSNNNIKKIIISKIIIELIKYYRGLEEFGNNIEEIKKIEENNLQIMENNINILNEFNLSIKEIKSKTMNEIYLEIISSLIKNNFEDDEYMEKIIKQLDIESINLIQINIKEIINKFFSSKKEDLFDNKKINLFYLLLKYIFKDRIYIYQIKFFQEARKSIIKLINSNKISFENFKKDNKERLEYIIKIIIDSEYYLKKYDEMKSHNNKKNDIKEKTPKIIFSSSKIIPCSHSIEPIESAKIENMDEIDDKLCLTKLKKIIGNHKRKKNQSKEYTSDFVSETSKFFISGGTNNEIIVYTKDSLIKIDNPYSPDDWVYNILENQENNFLVTEGTKIYTKVVLNSLLTLQIGEEFIVCCQNKVLLYNNKLIQWNNLDEKKVLYK